MNCPPFSIHLYHLIKGIVLPRESLAWQKRKRGKTVPLCLIGIILWGITGGIPENILAQDGLILEELPGLDWEEETAEKPILPPAAEVPPNPPPLEDLPALESTEEFPDLLEEEGLLEELPLVEEKNSELPKGESELFTEELPLLPELEENWEEEVKTGIAEELKTEFTLPSFLLEPEKKWTAEEQSLLTRIRRTLRIYRQISLATQENSPSEIMLWTLPFGCQTEIYRGCREDENRINAIAALCWNIPMGEEVTFGGNAQQLIPRLGYGIQHTSGQLLAALAIARVPTDYLFPAAAGEERVFRVSDLVEFEKKRCVAGNDLSSILIGLSYYLSPEETWEANDGEMWNLERIVRNELERQVDVGTSEVTSQLLGLIYCLRCLRMRSADTTTGEFARAGDYLQKFRQFAFSLQNDAGCWHPLFFTRKGAVATDFRGMLLSSGSILQWLAAATPREELSDPALQKAVSVVEALLYLHLEHWDPATASSREIEGVCAALHALVIYEKRYFK